MKKVFETIFQSAFIQFVLTAISYTIYGAVVGIALIPTVALLVKSWRALSPGSSVGGLAVFSIVCGLGLFLYFVCGALVTSIAIRLLSWGVKPGRYPVASLTMFRWLLYNGLYHIAGKTILDFVPMGFLTTSFFRIVGAKIGRNVGINTWFLNDAYLLEIGDNVVIGGKTDVSCHTFEKGHLILQRIRIGEGTLVGQHCYISPGVTVGKNCVIGQYAFIRKNKTIPDKTVISAIAGLPLRAVAEIEKRGDAAPSR